MWILHEILDNVQSIKMYRDREKYYIEVYDIDSKYFYVENKDLEDALREVRDKLGI